MYARASPHLANLLLPVVGVNLLTREGSLWEKLAPNRDGGSGRDIDPTGRPREPGNLARDLADTDASVSD